MRPGRRPLVVALTLALPVAWAPSAARADRLDACIGAAEESQRLRIDGRLGSAREQLLVCVQAECPAAIRSDCARWMSEIDAIMPSMVIQASDERGADVVDVRVTVDNQPTLAKLDGKEIRVDPGTHVFRFTRPESPPVGHARAR